MKRYGLFLCVSLMFAVSVNANEQGRADSVVSVCFKDVDCKFATCTAKKEHGNMTIKYQSGKTVAVISDGTCQANNSVGTDAKVSPDRKLVGLLTGVHFNDSANNYYFGGAKLCLFKEGKCVLKITGEKYFIEEWHFWEKGKQIILRSRAKHGVGTVERYDATTGRLLEKFVEYKVDAKYPEWARRIALL
jgi:hypothetical protein